MFFCCVDYLIKLTAFLYLLVLQLVFRNHFFFQIDLQCYFDKFDHQPFKSFLTIFAFFLLFLIFQQKFVVPFRYMISVSKFIQFKIHIYFKIFKGIQFKIMTNEIISKSQISVPIFFQFLFKGYYLASSLYQISDGKNCIIARISVQILFYINTLQDSPYKIAIEVQFNIRNK